MSFSKRATEVKGGKFFFILRCLVSVGLLGYIIFGLRWLEIVSALKKLNPSWALAGSLLVPLLIASLAVRWKIFLNQQNIALTYRSVFMLTWVGQFFNSVLPGSTGGDVFKIYEVCRRNPSRKMAVAATVIADRLSALISLAILLLVSLFMAPALVLSVLQQMEFGRIHPGLLVGIAILTLVIFGTILAWKYLRKKVLQLGQILLGILAFKRTFWAAIAWSLLVHGISFFSFWAFARALGIQLDFVQVLIFLPVVFFAVLLPITVNGHGLREVLLFFYFQYLQIGSGGAVGLRETIIALSIIMVTNEFLWSLFPCLWLMNRGWSKERLSCHEADR